MPARLVHRQSRGEASRDLGESTRLNHFAQEVGDPSEWVQIVDKIEARGLDPEFGEAGIAWQVYFHNPEGVKLEVYVDRRDTAS